MNQTTTMKKSMSWWTLLSSFARNVGISLPMAYLTFYMTNRMLLSIAVMGTIMTLSRIIDLIIGVICGPIVQKVMTKMGTYRTWLFWGSIFVSIGIIMCFINPNISMMGKAVIVFIGYILYGADMSFLQLSSNGLVTKIAGPDMATRINLMGKLGQGQTAAGILTGAITVPLVMLFDKMGTDGYTVVQIIFSVLLLLGQIPLFFASKEYDPYNPNFKSQGAGSVKLGTMLGQTLKNGQLIIIVIKDIIFFASLMTLMSVTMYYFAVVMHNPMMMATAMTISSIVMFVGTLIAPMVINKIGKRSAAIVSLFLTAACSLCIAFFAMKGIVYFIIFNSITSFFSSVSTIAYPTFYFDCGEYQLFKTGKDTRTFALSLYGISVKIGFIISTVITAGMLLASQFNGATGTFASPSTFVFLLGAIPAIAYALCAILMIIYRITDAKAREYTSANHEKLQQSEVK